MRRRGSYASNDIISFCAYIALVVSALLLILTFVFRFIEISATIIGVLALIRDLAFLVGVGLAAYNYTRGKSKATRVIFWIAAITYFVIAILGLVPFK